MIVISLFDGIACGKIALERVGVSIEKYYASEIEPNAIKVATTKNKEIVEIGDVCKVSYADGVLQTEKGRFEVGTVDLLCGGSPCTNFSSIGYANGMKSGDTDILSLEQYLELKALNTRFEGQSFLFWEFVRLLHEIKPKFFLLENVVMAQRWEKIITDNLGVNPLRINSSLVSAQNRPRLYWTNIDVRTVPQDEKITLDDILDGTADDKDVAYCQTVQRSFPRLIEKYEHIPAKFNAYNAAALNEKGCALSRGSMITSSCATLLFVEKADGVHVVKGGKMDGKYAVKLPDGRYNIRKLSVLESERLQTLPDGYTDVEGVAEQKRREMIGNGWTVDVIAHIFKYIPKG